MSRLSWRARCTTEPTDHQGPGGLAAASITGGVGWAGPQCERVLLAAETKAPGVLAWARAGRSAFGAGVGPGAAPEGKGIPVSKGLGQASELGRSWLEDMAGPAPPRPCGFLASPHSPYSLLIGWLTPASAATNVPKPPAPGSTGPPASRTAPQTLKAGLRAGVWKKKGRQAQGPGARRPKDSGEGAGAQGRTGCLTGVICTTCCAGQAPLPGEAWRNDS